MNTSTSIDRSTVIAFFRNPGAAETAISNLHDAGFRADQIGCSCDNDYDVEGGSHIGGESSVSGDRRSFWDKVSDFFSGNDEQVSGDGYEPGRSMRIPQSYYDRLSSGGAFVSESDVTRRAEAEQILRRSGGEIETNLRSFEPVKGESRAVTGEHRIQLLSEQMRVRKERVSQGEVRLRKEVRTERQNIEVPVTREELVVEHVPTTERSATDRNIGRDQDIRVPLSEERVTVEKQPVVRDEVRVAKRNVEEKKNVSDDIRHEELRVDDDRNLVKDKRGVNVADPKGRKTA